MKSLEYAREFGAKNGMLLITGSQVISAYQIMLAGLSYSFPCLSELVSASSSLVMDEPFIETLHD